MDNSIAEELLQGSGEVGPLLRIAYSRLFRSSVWVRVAQAFHLTPAERQVAMLLAAGKTPDQIGETLECKHTTVTTRIRTIRIKLLLPAEDGTRQSTHRVTAKLMLAAVGYLDHGLPGESDA